VGVDILNVRPANSTNLEIDAKIGAPLSIWSPPVGSGDYAPSFVNIHLDKNIAKKLFINLFSKKSLIFMFVNVPFATRTESGNDDK
jgi:hypothetical protein